MDIKQRLIDYKDKNLLTKSIPFKEQFGYAGGAFGQGMGQDCVTSYGDKFQREFMRINAEMMFIKNIFLTVIGFFIPPIAGKIYDSINPKRSNIKLGLLISPIPFTLASLMLFLVPSNSPAFNLVWVIFFGLLFNIGETFYSIAMNVLALKMLQKNPNDRKNFYTLSSLASTVGSMLPGWLMYLFVDDSDMEKWLHFFVAIGFCSIGFIFMYAPTMRIDMTKSVFFRPMEGVAAEKKPHEKIHWNRKNISLILHNRPFIVVQAATLCESVRRVSYDSLSYVYDNVLGHKRFKVAIDPISGVLSYVGLFIFPVLCDKISAPKIASAGYSYSALIYLAMSLFNVSSLCKGTKGLKGTELDSAVIKSMRVRSRKWPLGLLIGLSGMPNYLQSTAKNIVVADSTDYMEWYAEKKYGEPVHSDGLLLAAQGLVGKVNELLKKGLLDGLFKVIDFREGGENNNKAIQSFTTLRGIFRIFSLCGFIGNLLAAVCFLFDNYTGGRQKKILEELAEFRKARSALEDEMRQVPSAT